MDLLATSRWTTEGVWGLSGPKDSRHCPVDSKRMKLGAEILTPIEVVAPKWKMPERLGEVISPSDITGWEDKRGSRSIWGGMWSRGMKTKNGTKESVDNPSGVCVCFLMDPCFVPVVFDMELDERQTCNMVEYTGMGLTSLDSHHRQATTATS